MKILISGPQGSGKTTQAKILAQKLGLQFASTGDLLRAKAQEDSVEAISLRDDLAAGRLVDDKLAAKILIERLQGPEYEQGFILDGYPREMNQLREYDPQYDWVLYLDVSDKEVIKRLLVRGRADDTPELIKERLDIYHQKTEPVLKYYEGLGKLIKIDASKSIKEVAKNIEGKIQDKVSHG